MPKTVLVKIDANEANHLASDGGKRRNSMNNNEIFRPK